MAVHELPKDVLKMASGLISPSGLAGHRGQLCMGPDVDNIFFTINHQGSGPDGHVQPGTRNNYVILYKKFYTYFEGKQALTQLGNIAF